MVSEALSAPPALAALMVALKVPETAGLPLIKPVAVFTLSPAGRPLAA
jgi:hypothetical protein